MAGKIRYTHIERNSEASSAQCDEHIELELFACQSRHKKCRPRTMSRIFTDFATNTTFHGIHFIVEGRTWWHR